jgi:hypothetical protein
MVCVGLRLGVPEGLPVGVTVGVGPVAVGVALPFAGRRCASPECACASLCARSAGSGSGTA